MNTKELKMLTKPTTPLSKREPDGFLKISLNLTMGIGITTFIAALTLIAVHFYDSKSQYRDTLNFAVTTLATAAGISSAVYALRGIEINLEDKKIDRTLRYIQIWNDPSYFSVRQIAAKIHKDLKPLDETKSNEYMNQIYADAEKKQEIVNILNFLEEMSMCVHFGLVDEKCLKEFYRYIVCTYCDTFTLFVHRSRRDKQSPRLYIHLTDLCEQWRH
ncbi:MULTISPECIES: DUF4760 domain-containing protein [unclassified Microcoleus]|uniref:DUF4760 domain-containing protein n=2 Tax=Microcoleus TaxID=44471 RepID=UPI002FCF0213